MHENLERKVKDLQQKLLKLQQDRQELNKKKKMQQEALAQKKVVVQKARHERAKLDKSKFDAQQRVQEYQRRRNATIARRQQISRERINEQNTRIQMNALINTQMQRREFSYVETNLANFANFEQAVLNSEINHRGNNSEVVQIQIMRRNKACARFYTFQNNKRDDQQQSYGHNELVDVDALDNSGMDQTEAEQETQINDQINEIDNDISELNHEVRDYDQEISNLDRQISDSDRQENQIRNNESNLHSELDNVRRELDHVKQEEARIEEARQEEAGQEAARQEEIARQEARQLEEAQRDYESKQFEGFDKGDESTLGQDQTFENTFNEQEQNNDFEDPQASSIYEPEASDAVLLQMGEQHIDDISQDAINDDARQEGEKDESWNNAENLNNDDITPEQNDLPDPYAGEAHSEFPEDDGLTAGGELSDNQIPTEDMNDNNRYEGKPEEVGQPNHDIGDTNSEAFNNETNNFVDNDSVPPNDQLGEHSDSQFPEANINDAVHESNPIAENSDPTAGLDDFSSQLGEQPDSQFPDANIDDAARESNPIAENTDPTAGLNDFESQLGEQPDSQVPDASINDAARDSNPVAENTDPTAGLNDFESQLGEQPDSQALETSINNDAREVSSAIDSINPTQEQDNFVMPSGDLGDGLIEEVQSVPEATPTYEPEQISETPNDIYTPQDAPTQEPASSYSSILDQLGGPAEQQSEIVEVEQPPSEDRSFTQSVTDFVKENAADLADAVMDAGITVAHEVGAISEEVKENLEAIADWGDHLIEKASNALSPSERLGAELNATAGQDEPAEGETYDAGQTEASSNVSSSI